MPSQAKHKTVRSKAGNVKRRQQDHDPARKGGGGVVRRQQISEELQHRTHHLPVSDRRLPAGQAMPWRRPTSSLVE